jgi:hypothetical protein
MKRLAGALIIVSLAAIAGRYAYSELSKLSWFNLTEVRIDCSNRTKQEDILKASNLKIGESIFKQDLEYAGNALLEIPGVEVVKINRQLPSSVEIKLVSDQIELLIKTNKLYGLTRTLKLIDIENLELVLPVVTDVMGSSNLSYSNKMKSCYALMIHDQLRLLSSSLADRLSEIHFCKSGMVELFFNPGGVKVLLHLRNHQMALNRLSILDSKGLLGNSGSFDMTAGRMVVKSEI